MAIVFNQRIKQDQLDLEPNVVLAFADPLAEAYFVAAGWASTSTKRPVTTYPEGSVRIDPYATFADGPRKNQKVLEV